MLLKTAYFGLSDIFSGGVCNWVRVSSLKVYEDKHIMEKHRFQIKEHKYWIIREVMLMKPISFGLSVQFYRLRC